MLYFFQTRLVYLLHGIKLPPNIRVDLNSLSENQIKNTITLELHVQTKCIN